MAPFSVNLERAVRPNDFRNINWALMGPNEVSEYLPDALAQLKDTNQKPTPLVDKWASTLPPNSPAIRVNSPLIYFITFALTYPDSKLACEFSKGSPLLGEIEERNVLAAKPRGAPLSLDTWKRGIPARNRKSLRNSESRPAQR